MATAVIVFQFADIFQLLSLILLILVLSSWVLSIRIMWGQKKKLKQLEQAAEKYESKNFHKGR